MKKLYYVSNDLSHMMKVQIIPVSCSRRRNATKRHAKILNRENHESKREKEELKDAEEPWYASQNLNPVLHLLSPHENWICNENNRIVYDSRSIGYHFVYWRYDCLKIDIFIYRRSSGVLIWIYYELKLQFMEMAIQIMRTHNIKQIFTLYTHTFY